MSISEQKASLRAESRAKFSALTAVERAAASRAICESIAGAPVWNSAKTVLVYAPLADEVDIFPLVDLARAAGKVVCLPRFSAAAVYEAARITDSARDLVPGRFQVREPAPHCPVATLNQLDLVFVPGVAFDPSGRRLGRGKGYYDRILTAVRGTKCGVAFECQVTAAIPEEPHDVKVDCLVTEARWLEFRPAPRL